MSSFSFLWTYDEQNGLELGSNYLRIRTVLASMPIRKSISAAGRRVDRLSTLKLFTDRNYERALLHHFFEQLATVHPVQDVRPEKLILSIWGVGGIGKSRLLEKATAELDPNLVRLRLIALDLDHDRWTPSSSLVEFFWHLRSRLWAARPRSKGGGAGIETPLFDYLYFTLWRAQHPGENFALNDSVLTDLLNTSTLGTTTLAEASAKLAAGVSEAATVGAAIGGLFQLLGKTLTYLRNRARKSLLNKRGLNPESMTEKEMEAELAPVLAADVEQWLEDHPDNALCVAIDGFERIQSTVLAEDIQKYLADWCGILTDPDAVFSGRFGCVLLGRNKNRWPELYDKEWETRINEHHVGGLLKENALELLESIATYHQDHGDLTTASNFRKHSGAILAATREQHSHDKLSSFHPYYLDLAYGIVYEQGVHFQPADLGRTPADLQIRFLRYLQTGHPGVFETFRCLALAGSFDEALFDHLVEILLIPAGLHFAALTGGDYSVVEEIRDLPGTFRFHRLMELALIRNQSAKAEDRLAARQRIDVILDYFKKKAQFSKLADCTTQHLSAYQKGMTIAFDRHHDDLLDMPLWMRTSWCWKSHLISARSSALESVGGASWPIYGRASSQMVHGRWTRCLGLLPCCTPKAGIQRRKRWNVRSCKAPSACLGPTISTPCRPRTTWLILCTHKEICRAPASYRSK